MTSGGADHGDGWYDEIDLDPEGTWLRMGTRNLGSRPWLIVDHRRDEELALKHRLLAERHSEVFAVCDDALGPGNETLALVGEWLDDNPVEGGPGDGSRPGGQRLHPLEQSGRLVQEDLCLLRPHADGQWILAGASLCFPSRWRLADKMGKPLIGVHGPVAGYQSVLAARVDSLLGRLDGRVVWRRNWFVHPDGSLFQPQRPPGGDPVVEGGDWKDRLFLRSERQTLRRLEPSGWVLFTIRIQHDPLWRLLADGERRRRFVRFLTEAHPDLVAHRGMDRPQVEALVSALAPTA